MPNQIIKSMQQTILDPFGEITKEVLEAGIDLAIDNEIIRAIPVINTLHALYKVGSGIRERHLLKQSLLFLNELQSVEPAKLEAYRKKLKNDETFAEEEIERVMILLEKSLYKEQAERLGRFYRAYIEGKIAHWIFMDLCIINDKLFPSDFMSLCNIRYNMAPFHQYEANRLSSLGLIVTKEPISEKPAIYITTTIKEWYVLSSMGETFFKLAYENK